MINSRVKNSKEDSSYIRGAEKIDPFDQEIEEPDNLFNPYLLPVDDKLPLPVINQTSDTLKLNKDDINISVTIPNKVWRSNLYLYINKKKKDLFYYVPSGNYVFKNILIDKGENVIEIFYKSGNKRSKEKSFIVIKE